MKIDLKTSVMLDRYTQKYEDVRVGDYVYYNDKSIGQAYMGIVAEVFKARNEAMLALDGFKIYAPLDECKPLKEKTWQEVARRVSDDILTESYDILLNKDFIPAGRILHGAGSGKELTYFNCYVLPFPKDSRKGIAEHRQTVMEIMSRGGGVGTNGSTLRPTNAKAKAVGGVSSGAISWLEDLSRLTHLVEQGGSRRGAQMIMMYDWHPNIIEFLTCKIERQEVLDEINAKYGLQLKVKPQNTINIAGDFLGKHKYMSGANLSVAITDDFMEAVRADGMHELRFPAIDDYDEEQMAYYDEHWHEIGDVREWKLPVKTYATIPAKMLWDIIMIANHSSAEGGMFFIDNANKMTNARSYGQKVVSTNPCGEQPLAPYSVCNLGAINLANMVDKKRGVVLWNKLKEVIRIAVRFSDNVIDKTHYFLYENEKQAKSERRVGLGVMGLHDLLLWTGHKYGSLESMSLIKQLFSVIANTAYMTSAELAKEKGTFPLYNESFLDGAFIKRLDPAVREAIKAHGIRNSHLLTVAPTGSTGTMVGGSTGLEPYFAFKFYRSGNLGESIEIKSAILEEYLAVRGADADMSHFVSAMELSHIEHVRVQNAIQYYVDSSISKTINAPHDITIDEVSEIYFALYDGGAKGGTIYRDGSRNAQVLSTTSTKDEGDSGTDEPFSDLPADYSEGEVDVHYVNYDNKANTCDLCGAPTTNSGGCVTCTECGAQLKCGL